MGLGLNQISMMELFWEDSLWLKAFGNFHTKKLHQRCLTQLHDIFKNGFSRVMRNFSEMSPLALTLRFALFIMSVKFLLRCLANQWSGSYMIRTSIKKELMSHSEWWWWWPIFICRMVDRRKDLSLISSQGNC